MKILKRGDSWQDPSLYLKKIFIDRSCTNDPYAEEIIGRADLPVTIIDEADCPSIIKGVYPENLSEGKTVLLLSKNKGTFLKDCPATREYQCCDYKVINIGTGCPMDCTYCILQAYLNNPYQSFFTNVKDMFRELTEELAQDTRFLRIGTGEFTDSMALDRITGMSRKLISFFADKDNCVLELKTKSGYIENLRDIDHNGRTVMAWSLNSEEIVMQEEMRAATIDERLEAAAVCSRLGYHLAFHFDPIIAYPGWEQGYKDTIEKLFEKVPASSIRWISLGGFRYIPKLKQIGTKRFPCSKIYHHEFIEGLDAKQRYFRPLRVQLYRYLYSLIKQFADTRTCIYFCMESDEIWKEVMGFTPGDYGGLPRMLDNSVNSYG
jgi:spore photoproduct lyase